MTKCEVLLKYSPYPRRKVTIDQVVDQAKKYYSDWENMNVLQWNSAHGDLPVSMINHAHYLIIDGFLVKSRHGW